MALFLPLEDDAEVRVAPEIEPLDAGTARRWVLGHRPLDLSTIEAVDAHASQAFNFESIGALDLTGAPREVREAVVDRWVRMTRSLVEMDADQARELKEDLVERLGQEGGIGLDLDVIRGEGE